MINFEMPEKHASNRLCRLIGIVSVAVGLLLAKWQIYDPLHAAEQQRRDVEIFLFLVALAVYLSVFGILLLLFGNRPIQWFKIDPQDLRLKNTVNLLLFAGIGLVVFCFVIASLESQGYEVKRGW